ncbi:hypothetical protein ABVT39_005702 [Epinephelus coioides]
MIQAKAMVVFSETTDRRDDDFHASQRWLEWFMKRINLTIRKRTSLAQKNAEHYINKLVNFVIFCSHKIAEKKLKEYSTVDTVGVKSVTLKTTGHEKSHITVGTKLKPYIVFKGGVREVKAMAAAGDCREVVLASSKNGWMDDSLTSDCLNKVIGKRLFGECLLVWDSYMCHISQATKAELKNGYRLQMAVAPGGCDCASGKDLLQQARLAEAVVEEEEEEDEGETFDNKHLIEEDGSDDEVDEMDNRGVEAMENVVGEEE